jgi:hypothetical protein
MSTGYDELIALGDAVLAAEQVAYAQQQYAAALDDYAALDPEGFNEWATAQCPRLSPSTRPPPPSPWHGRRWMKRSLTSWPSSAPGEPEPRRRASPLKGEVGVWLWAIGKA